MSITKTAIEFFDNAKKVYNLLEDDKSKDIFLNRLLYNTTDDFNYIDIMVRNNVEQFNEIDVVNQFKEELKLIIKKNKKLVIYGASTIAPSLFSLIDEYVYCFCDKDKNKQKAKFCGMPVISPEELIESKDEYIVIISILDFYDEVYKFLNDNNIEILPCDYTSKLQSLHKNQYFDEELISFSDNEIFIDVGSYNFGTSQNLLNKCDSVSKIYAFEPHPVQYLISKENSKDNSIAAVFPYGLWNETTELIFDDTLGPNSKCINDECKADRVIVKTAMLDDILNGEKATFIKMDIEGAELNALKGAKETIIKYKPKLAVCVYHKKEDIIDIPMYIHNLVPDYKLYMRHYSNNANETVLYAVK